MVATSSNYKEIIAIHEASHECIWLRSMIQHIQESCKLPSIKDSLRSLFEDNVASLHISKEVISKEIELNTFLQSPYMHMNFKRVVQLMFNNTLK